MAGQRTRFDRDCRLLEQLAWSATELQASAELFAQVADRHSEPGVMAGDLLGAARALRESMGTVQALMLTVSIAWEGGGAVFRVDE